LIDAEAARFRGTVEIAAVTGVRAETLCRWFRRFLGCTPGDYLRGRRMRLAAERLREPGARVKGVALELGFADAFHFSRVFRKEMGVSPREWRAAQSERESGAPGG
jgi:AraC family transcriptional regulator